jgi:phage terminase large subunit-like protein
VRDLAAAYDLQGAAYDPRFFDLPAQMLADEGYPMLEFPQSVERLSPAVGETFEAVKRGELSHDGDEAFEAQVLNAVARYNERGFMLAKSKSKDRIDAAVALCMAHSIAARPQARTGTAPWAVYA